MKKFSNVLLNTKKNVESNILGLGKGLELGNLTIDKEKLLFENSKLKITIPINSIKEVSVPPEIGTGDLFCRYTARESA